MRQPIWARHDAAYLFEDFFGMRARRSYVVLAAIVFVAAGALGAREITKPGERHDFRRFSLARAVPVHVDGIVEVEDFRSLFQIGLGTVRDLQHRDGALR